MSGSSAHRFRVSYLSLAAPRDRLIAAVVSGIMIAAAESLHPWWPIAWIAPIPLLAAAFVAPRREAATLAALAGIIGSLSTTSYYIEVAGPVVTVLVPLGRALTLAIVVSITRLTVVRWRHWASIFVFPALMTSLDMIIASISRHGSSGSLAYSQMDALPVIQFASLAGTSGIVFVVSLFASTVAVAWYHHSNSRHYRTGYVLAATAIVLVLAFGVARLATAPAEPDVQVGLIVIDTAPNPHASSPDAPLWKTYEDAIADVARRGAHIVVLPEKIAAFTPKQAAQLRQALARVAESNKIYLLVGLTILEPTHKENRAWLFNPVGEVEADYAKRHLVPGFEDAFVPGGRIVARIIDGALTGIAICKDMDFPGLGRDYAELEMRMMLVPAWDFRRDGWLHSRMAILRGVEGGYTIVRAARNGLLTISDRYGRVLYQTASSARPYASIVENAPLGTGRETIYGAAGDLFGWIALGFALIVSLRAAISVSLWNWLRAGSR